MNFRRARIAAVMAAVCAAMVMPARPQSGPSAIRHVPGKDLERLPDGSSGRVVEYRGADGAYIPAYIRTPKGPGPFPVVIVFHGGPPGPDITYALGRTTNPPAADFVAAGWAVAALDYHPNPTVPSTDREDAMAGIEAVRRLPFIEGRKVALYGGSHGGNVISRLASRVDVRCGVLCAPALLDLIEISKVIDRGTEVAGILKKMVAAAPQKYGAPLAQVAKDPAHYGYDSALLEAPQVRFPLLLINGRNDTSAPIAVTQTYVERLHAAGKEVMTHFPDDAQFKPGDRRNVHQFPSTQQAVSQP